MVWAQSSFLHRSSSVSRDWEEETGSSVLRIPQVLSGIWRQWICEGLSASCSAHSKDAPVLKREEKRKAKRKTQKLLWCQTALLAWVLVERSAMRLALRLRAWHGVVLLAWFLHQSLFPACFCWDLKGRNLYPHLHLGKSSFFSVLVHNLLLALKIGSQGFLGLFSLLCRLSGILNTHDPYQAFVEVALSKSSNIPYCLCTQLPLVKLGW